MCTRVRINMLSSCMGALSRLRSTSHQPTHTRRVHRMPPEVHAMNSSIDRIINTSAHAARMTVSALLALSLLSLTLAGCGAGTRSSQTSTTSTSPSTPGAESGMGMPPEGISHTITDDDRAYLTTKQPLEADQVTLFVNGLSCPLCASNVDSQLLSVKGVSKVTVDLNRGQVDLTLTDPKPSPWALSNAIDRSGFTLVRIARNP